MLLRCTVTTDMTVLLCRSTAHVHMRTLHYRTLVVLVTGFERDAHSQRKALGAVRTEPEVNQQQSWKRNIIRSYHAHLLVVGIPLQSH